MMNLGSCFLNSPSCIIHHIPGGRGGGRERGGGGRDSPVAAMKAWMMKKRGRLSIDCLQRERESKVCERDKLER